MKQSSTNCQSASLTRCWGSYHDDVTFYPSCFLASVSSSTFLSSVCCVNSISGACLENRGVCCWLPALSPETMQGLAPRDHQWLYSR